jgi:hypothetical protein
MPPQFTKSEWYTEVDETDGIALPDAPILTVTVHDEDETNKFHYKVRVPFQISRRLYFLLFRLKLDWS